ncbi:MAG TPA: hydroxyisourate hydrolase [Thermoanaerobaculia bacterium]|nr:hydroxyisourate hydrolase [Thermoanaerobaculia bacterium]
MSGISSHVLDTSRGRPASGVRVALEIRVGDRWQGLGSAAADSNGRVAQLLPAGAALAAGIYRLSFDTGGYFRSQGVEPFFPQVVVVFEVRDPDQHYHVPLLLSPFGYSTYRGS